MVSTSFFFNIGLVCHFSIIYHSATNKKNYSKRILKIFHQFYAQFRTNQKFFLSNKNKHPEIENNIFPSQLGSELTHADFFVVYGFKGDPNLAYIFLTSNAAELFHKSELIKYFYFLKIFIFIFNSDLLPNFNEVAYADNVLDSKNFVYPREKRNVYLSEIPSEEHASERVEDDSFVIAFKMHFRPDENIKVRGKNIGGFKLSQKN